MFRKYLKWTFCIIFFLIICLILIQTYKKYGDWILSNKFNLPWDEQTNIIAITPQTSFCQYFTAIDDNLSRIDVMFRKGHGSYNFSFYGIDSKQSHNLIYESSFINIAQNYDFYSFYFPSIFESLRKKFQFCISTDIVNSNPIGLFPAKVSDNSALQYSYGITNQLHDGAIVFQAYSRHPISFVKFYSILFNRISQYKPFLVKTPWIFIYFIAYILIIVFISGIIFKFLINHVNRNRQIKKE